MANSKSAVPSPKSTKTIFSNVGASQPHSKAPSVDQISTAAEGDQAVVAEFYKVRRAQRFSRSRTCCCSVEPYNVARCWAFVNLFYSILDISFSFLELIEYAKISINNGTYREEREQERTGLFLVSFVMHGDCEDVMIDLLINTAGELAYFGASLLFAFAMTLEKEDYEVCRYLVKWFVFSVWIPPMVLFPRLVLNVSTDCGKHLLELFPHSNENIPKITFWIANLLHVFFLLLWMAHGRNVGNRFLKFQKDEHNYYNKLHSDHYHRNMFLRGSKENLLSPASSLYSTMGGGAGDKALKQTGIGAMLPPSVAMV